MYFKHVPSLFFSDGRVVDRNNSMDSLFRTLSVKPFFIGLWLGLQFHHHKNIPYCKSFVLMDIVEVIFTVHLPLHRWERELSSLSGYESPSNRQVQVFSVPRLSHNPALQWGCHLDCFQRSDRDIAGSGKIWKMLLLIMMTMMVTRNLLRRWEVLGGPL